MSHSAMPFSPCGDEARAHGRPRPAQKRECWSPAPRSRQRAAIAAAARPVPAANAIARAAAIRPALDPVTGRETEPASGNAGRTASWDPGAEPRDAAQTDHVKECVVRRPASEGVGARTRPP